MQTKKKSAGKHKKIVQELLIAEQMFPLFVARRRGARSMTLRFNPLDRTVTLTLPHYTALAEGMHFVSGKTGWLADIIAAQHVPVRFEPLQTVSLMGKEFTLLHRPRASSAVNWEEATLTVSGAKEFFARRVKDLITREAKQHFTQLAREKATALNKTVRRVTLKDTHSRWGSCSSDGCIALSWRLAFAPPEVIDYVISHEVAHLAELNHSKRFWKTVGQLCPDYECWKDWLKYHGHALYRFTV